MIENNLHNLMTQMTQENKSLWRIENHYIKESANEEERSFWEKMLKDKKDHIEEIRSLLKNQI